MRSRAELLLRALGVAALLAWVALALMPRARGTVAVTVADAPASLRDVTRAGAVAPVHLRADSVPGATTTAWLAALRRSGAKVSWSGTLAPVAVEAYRSADPRAAIVVLAAGTGSMALTDGLGMLDSLRAGESRRFAAAEGTLMLREGRAVAAVAPPPSRREPRKVLVAGAVGWEAKFVIAALEEAGWRVDARLVVAPGREVVQGRPAPLDTATYAAVVLLDSAAASAVRGVDAFVRAGGGAVLAGSANASGRMASIAGWRAGRREVAALGTLPADTAWRGLARVPLTLVTDRGALALETRDGRAAVAARRHHAGRVAAVGYDETWRWRMAGGTGSVAAHREWWSRIVAGVAARHPAGAAQGSAPLATLHRVLGAPSAVAAPIVPRVPRDALGHALGFVALVSLLAEWLARRARGAR